MAASGNIAFVLSGGTANTDPNESLGGLPSPVQIDDQIDNLFDDVTEQEAGDGKPPNDSFGSVLAVPPDSTNAMLPDAAMFWYLGAPVYGKNWLFFASL
jgi:hypothetical protein